MTSDTVSVISFFFSSATQLLTSFHIPGTNVTPLALMLFAAIVPISLKIIKGFLNNK